MSKVPNTKENIQKCICSICPTWMVNDCPKNKVEGLYCATGISACNLLEKGCVCGTCPIWEEYSLSKGYFCLYGEAV